MMRRGGSIAMLGMMLGVMPAAAQNLSFGADNWYQSDIVTVQPITFQTQNNLTITGNLFHQTNLSDSANASAIVVGHPMGATKEQAANLYATKLAEQGFVTVSLDLPHWGTSDGEPQAGVAPEEFTEAYSAAVDYLGTQTGSLVDRERIGVLGICASGGFVISAAKIDSRIKAVATASMYDMGDVTRTGLQHVQSVEERKEVIAAASAARWAELEGAEVQLTGGTVLELTDESTPVEAEFFDFYRTSRGQFTPEGWEANRTTRPTFSSNVKFLNFYPFSDIDTISPRPILFVAGDQAHSLYFSEDAYAGAAEPKELFLLPGVGHVDLYDRTELIPFDKFTDFFKANL